MAEPAQGSAGAASSEAAAPAVIGAAERRRLTLFDVVCIGVNATVGSGVFALPDDVYREMGGWSPLAFAACALILLPVSLCMAELAARTDETGGPYVYARRAFGEEAGFVVGWFCWVATVVAWAAVTTLFVEIIGKSVGLGGVTTKAIGFLMVLGLGAINYVGVKPGTWVVNLVTVGKLVAIFTFVGVGLFHMKGERLGGPFPSAAHLGTGVYLTLFPLQGFEVAPVAAGETKNPRRNVPLGTVGALVFSAILYVVVQSVLVASYPALSDKTATPLQDAAKYLGPGIGAIVLFGSLVSTGGFTAGSALGSPRYAEAMSKDGVFPALLSRIHPRFGTPYMAIVATSIFAAALVLPFDYRRLVGIGNITVVAQYVASCLAVPALRRKHPADASRWRAPFGPALAIFGAAGSIALLFAVDVGEWKFAGGSLLVGLCVYGWVRRTRRGARRVDGRSP